MKIQPNRNGKTTNTIWKALEQRHAEVQQREAQRAQVQKQASAASAQPQTPSDIVVKTANKDISFKLTKAQWIQLGQKTGWLREAQSAFDVAPEGQGGDLDLYAVLQDTPKEERAAKAEELKMAHPEKAEEIEQVLATLDSEAANDAADFNEMGKTIDLYGHNGGFDEIEGTEVPDHASALLGKKKPVDNNDLL